MVLPTKKRPRPILARTKVATKLDDIVDATSGASSKWHQTSLQEIDGIPKRPGVYCFVLPQKALPKERVLILHGRTFGSAGARRQLQFRYKYAAQAFARGHGLVVYVGKAANLHGRVKAHLSIDVRATTNQVLRGLVGCPHYRVTSPALKRSRSHLLQSGTVFYYEHYHRDELCNDCRVMDDVGESAVAERDLLEIKLIAKYAPPFNLKAER